MKLGILTFHRADNYGAILQAYALFTSCEKLGYDAEIIDYRCQNIEKNYQRITFPKKIEFNIDYAKKIYIFFKYGHKLRLKKDKFEEFRSTMSLSKSYSKNEKLEVENKYNIIVTGSDQIWNAEILDGIDNWYCYERVSSTPVVVISYAASVGSLQEFDSRFGDYKRLLRMYDGLSVREKKLQEYLNKNGFTDAISVLDPTLLLEEDKWDELAGNVPYFKDKYLFYYDVEENEEAKKAAIKISQNVGIKLVTVTRIRKLSNNCINCLDVGPLEFLNLIKYADYVIGSSFHLCVFSVVFQKKFLSFMHPTTGDRVSNFLYEIGLGDRIAGTCKDMDLIYNEIDYCNVLQYINKKRNNSLEYLKSFYRG